jgi:hypothetical protein
MARSELMAALSEKIQFHRRWQTITMLGYVIPVVLQAIGSLGATITAAGGDAQSAAILSGLATASLLIEKTLKLREKWRLHLRVRTNLEALQLRVSMGLKSPEEGTRELAALLESYVERLPIAERDDTDDESARPSVASSAPVGKGA